jgi:hypothetical protein
MPGVPDLASLSSAELLGMYGRILAELRRRKAIRTLNAPAGDYAEYLVAAALGATLAPNSAKTWDLVDPAGRRVQVKARVLPNLTNRGQRQLSFFRSFDFDELVIVLFTADYAVWRSVRLPSATAEARSRWIEHVHGYRLVADDALLAEAIDITAAVQAAAVTPRTG